jgi:hypothetical protein
MLILLDCEEGDHGLICPDDPIEPCHLAELLGISVAEARGLFKTYRCKPTVGNAMFIAFVGNVELAARLGGKVE